MQFLVFYIGKDRYALATRCISRVLPLLECKQLPHAPPYVAGLINYHGTAIPVIDMSMLAQGVSARARLDTRIVLVDLPACGSCGGGLVGLIAEQVIGTERLDPGSFRLPGIASDPEARYLGKVASEDSGTLLQLIELEPLLPESVRAMLFAQAQEARC